MNFFMIQPMSPEMIDDKLKVLFDYLNVNFEAAQHLEFTSPSLFVPEVDQCHFNVWCQIREEGGSPQFGWMIFQDKAANFVEAIFHSVWRAPDERLIDVTPRKDNEVRILFIPDDSRAITLLNYGGRPAIRTFGNARMYNGLIAQPPEEFIAVIDSDFPKRMCLWPW